MEGRGAEDESAMDSRSGGCQRQAETKATCPFEYVQMLAGTQKVADPSPAAGPGRRRCDEEGAIARPTRLLQRKESGIG